MKSRPVLNVAPEYYPGLYVEVAPKEEYAPTDDGVNFDPVNGAAAFVAPSFVLFSSF